MEDNDVDLLTKQLNETAEETRKYRIKRDSELALLANYIMEEIPGKPSKNGVCQEAIRLLKMYRWGILAMGAQLVEMGEGAQEAGLRGIELVDGPSGELEEE